MGKCFNVTGPCDLQEHYMVSLDKRLLAIKKLIDGKKYFSINRGRQYGKTTTLAALKRYLDSEYAVVSLDFQFFTQTAFQDEYTFSSVFAKRFAMAAWKASGVEECALDEIKKCAERRDCDMATLFERLSDFCGSSEKPVVLMIDEVDNVSNNQVFIDFLALLRGYYIHRRDFSTFQSVIFAGVYDIKKLKQKIRPDAEHRNNSPWNIAVEFDVDMSLDPVGIGEMLAEYEKDYHTGMDIRAMAELLYEYTSGYPFLVSRICQLIDEKIAGSQGFMDRKSAWTKAGFLEAEKNLLTEKNTLFESLINKLADFPELRKLIYSMLFMGEQAAFNTDNPIIDMADMFGFIKNVNGAVRVANRIFETRLYNLFLSEETTSRTASDAMADKNQFIQNGMLNMELLLEKFVEYWGDLYSQSDEKFAEDNGRKLFLLYLRTIINGVGNYYIKAQTRDRKRTDVIVNYGGRQYILEIKIWRGEEYNRRGEEQLADYLEVYHASEGYMLSFNFNKKKRAGIRKIICREKKIFEAVV